MENKSLSSKKKDSSTPVAKLSASMEERMIGNINELAMVETNILGAATDIKTIYVTSCNNEEGKTTTAIQTAYALTINGHSRVLLVDGNPRSPKLQSLFGLEDCPGLTEFISSVVTPEKVLHQTVYPNLSLMTFGHSIVERPFMTQKAHIDKFRKITEDFDYVVFDSNRILGSSDSTLISKLFDGVILTVECEKTKWEVVQKALEKMKNIDANVLGLVLSKRKFYIPKVLYGRE